MEALYLTHSPRSRVAIHPLNSQMYSDLGYLQNSSLQVNLDDLQSKIAQATGTPVYLKLDHLRRFLSPKDRIKGKNVITIHTLIQHASDMIKELKILFPAEQHFHQCQYLTCRILIFVQKSDLQGTAQTINKINSQLEYSTTERSTMINFLKPADYILKIPSTNQETSIRAILTTLSLPIPTDINLDPVPPPKLLLRSAEPNRNKHQPPNSITLNFHKNNQNKVNALIENLQLAVTQTYDDPLLFPIMLMDGHSHVDNPISLVHFYSRQLPQEPTNPTITNDSMRRKSAIRSPDKKKQRSHPPSYNTAITTTDDDSNDYYSIVPNILFNTPTLHSNQYPSKPPTQSVQPLPLPPAASQTSSTISSQSSEISDLMALFKELKPMLPMMKQLITTQNIMQDKQNDLLIQQHIQDQQIQSIVASQHFPLDDMELHDLDITMSPANNSSASSKRDRDAPPPSSQYSEDAEND